MEFCKINLLEVLIQQDVLHQNNRCPFFFLQVQVISDYLHSESFNLIVPCSFQT